MLHACQKVLYWAPLSILIRSEWWWLVRIWQNLTWSKHEATLFFHSTTRYSSANFFHLYFLSSLSETSAKLPHKNKGGWEGEFNWKTSKVSWKKVKERFWSETYFDLPQQGKAHVWIMKWNDGSVPFRCFRACNSQMVQAGAIFSVWNMVGVPHTADPALKTLKASFMMLPPPGKHPHIANSACSLLAALGQSSEPPTAATIIWTKSFLDWIRKKLY